MQKVAAPTKVVKLAKEVFGGPGHLPSAVPAVSRPTGGLSAPSWAAPFRPLASASAAVPPSKAASAPMTERSLTQDPDVPAPLAAAAASSAVAPKVLQQHKGQPEQPSAGKSSPMSQVSGVPSEISPKQETAACHQDHLPTPIAAGGAEVPLLPMQEQHQQQGPLQGAQPQPCHERRQTQEPWEAQQQDPLHEQPQQGQLHIQPHAPQPCVDPVAFGPHAATVSDQAVTAFRELVSECPTIELNQTTALHQVLLKSDPADGVAGVRQTADLAGDSPQVKLAADAWTRDPWNKSSSAEVTSYQELPHQSEELQRPPAAFQQSDTDSESVTQDCLAAAAAADAEGMFVELQPNRQQLPVSDSVDEICWQIQTCDDGPGGDPDAVQLLADMMSGTEHSQHLEHC